jgi:hypothetical protein
MASPWDCFGDEPAPACAAVAAVADVLACDHPFFALADAPESDDVDTALRAALAQLASEAPQLARDCARELDAAGFDAPAALLRVLASCASPEALVRLRSKQRAFIALAC